VPKRRRTSKRTVKMKELQALVISVKASTAVIATRERPAA